MTAHTDIETRKPGWGLIVANVLSYFVFLVTLAINGSELCGYLAKPSQYRMGMEMSGLLYSTRGMFLSLTSGMIVLCAVGLIAPMFVRSARVRTIVRTAVACLVVAFTAWLTSTVQ